MNPINDAFRKVADSGIRRRPGVYGVSGVGFCLEAQVLERRTKIPKKTNGPMVIGNLLHRAVVKPLVRKRFGRNWNPLKRRRYERVVTYTDERGFGIEGHIDADLPDQDCIIEFKTSSFSQFQRGDFITEAYIEQGNAYAAIVGRKGWKLWILWKGFEDLANETVISTIAGDTDYDAFNNEFLERVWMVDYALKNNEDLRGPEQDWECRRCSYLTECPKHAEAIKRIQGFLPVGLKQLGELMLKADKDLEATWEKTFEALRQLHLVKYDRSQRVWMWEA